MALPRVGRISAAASKGSRDDILTELLQRLAVEIDQTSDPRAVASLSARLVDVLDRVTQENPDDATKGSGILDELTARRAGRPEAG